MRASISQSRVSKVDTLSFTVFGWPQRRCLASDSGLLELSAKPNSSHADAAVSLDTTGHKLQNTSNATDYDEDDDPRWGDYDPRRPTGCAPGCSGWLHSSHATSALQEVIR